jgi:hypothetical protein
VERRWARLKEWWAVATRHEKTAASFSSEELHRSVSVFPASDAADAVGRMVARKLTIAAIQAVSLTLPQPRWPLRRSWQAMKSGGSCA